MLAPKCDNLSLNYLPLGAPLNNGQFFLRHAGDRYSDVSLYNQRLKSYFQQQNQND